MRQQIIQVCDLYSKNKIGGFHYTNYHKKKFLSKTHPYHAARHGLPVLARQVGESAQLAHRGDVVIVVVVVVHVQAVLGGVQVCGGAREGARGAEGAPVAIGVGRRVAGRGGHRLQGGGLVARVAVR